MKPRIEHIERGECYNHFAGILSDKSKTKIFEDKKVHNNGCLHMIHPSREDMTFYLNQGKTKQTLSTVFDLEPNKLDLDVPNEIGCWVVKSRNMAKPAADICCFLCKNPIEYNSYKIKTLRVGTSKISYAPCDTHMFHAGCGLLALQQRLFKKVTFYDHDHFYACECTA